MSGFASGLSGALLLAQGRAEGLDRVGPAPQDAARSFWAGVLCLPAFLFLRVLDWVWQGAPPHPDHAMALQLLAYVVGWAGFALASRPLVDAFGRMPRWPLFIAVWNWCNVVQYLLLAGAALPRLLGAPEWLDETAGLVAIGWAIWLEWYAIGLALDLGRLPAAALVALDLGIGLGLSAITVGLT
jgi:hypothetical protein